jgi:hypothetical protein
LTVILTPAHDPARVLIRKSPGANTGAVITQQSIGT